MNLCKDCKHCVAEARLCQHPNNVDVVNGTQISLSCDTLRASGGACGPEGRWFTGKDISVPLLNDPVAVPSWIFKGST